MTPPENSLFASGRKELSMSKTNEYYRAQDEDRKMLKEWWTNTIGSSVIYSDIHSKKNHLDPCKVKNVLECWLKLVESAEKLESLIHTDYVTDVTEEAPKIHIQKQHLLNEADNLMSDIIYKILKTKGDQHA